jgi:hypothetical protein
VQSNAIWVGSNAFWVQSIAQKVDAARLFGNPVFLSREDGPEALG